MKWNIVNMHLNKENRNLIDGQIVSSLAGNARAITFEASDPDLLIDLLSDANSEEHARRIIDSLLREKVNA